jgi:dihydropteroate synthase
MHLCGDFETMHKQEPVADILEEVSKGFRFSVEKAENCGVQKDSIALDVGIGFSKTFEQNLELIAKLGLLCRAFSDFPILIGTSRKSFIGKILNGAPTDQRLYGSLASAATAVWNGAKIVRVHDVKATVEVLKVVDKIKGVL